MMLPAYYVSSCSVSRRHASCMNPLRQSSCKSLQLRLQAWLDAAHSQPVVFLRSEWLSTVPTQPPYIRPQRTNVLLVQTEW